MSHGRHVNKMPNLGCVFATEPQTFFAVQGVVPILQVSSRPSSVTDLPQESPTPMVIHQDSVQLSPASVFVYQGNSPHLYRAARANHRLARGSNFGSSLVHTTSASATIPQPNLEESPMRPPPQP